MKKHTLKFFLFFTIVIILITLKTTSSHLTAPKNYGWGGVLSGDIKIDSLFIGSSHTRQSYDLKIIEKECRCNPYLFAYSGLGPSFIYIILKYLIEDLNIKPTQVVVEAYPFKILFKPRMYDDRIFHFAPFKVKTEIIKLLNANGDKKLDFTNYVSLFLTGRNETLLLSFFTNSLIKKYSYKGSYQFKVMTSVTQNEFQNFPKNLTKIENQKTIQWTVIEYYKKIIKLLKKNNINLLFIDPPLPANIRSSEMAKKTKSILLKALGANKSDYFAPWENQIEYTTNPLYFNDWNHLSSLGRSIFSKDVGALLTNLQHE